MNIKKAVPIILIIAIFITGCSTTRENSHETYKPYDSEEIRIYYPKKEDIPDDNHVEEWEKYIKGKYGMDIDLEYIPLYTPSSVREFLFKGQIAIHNYFDDSREANGLVYITSYEVLNQLKDASLIIPVESYIDGLPGIVNIDIGNIEAFSDSSGNTWAVPLSDGIATEYRTYNKEYLDAAGISAPRTIDELFEYGKLVSGKDFDGNEIRDTYLFDYYLTGRMSSFDDIFRAFGCYGSPGYPVQFNPHKQKFENFVLNPNFTEAMTFIKLLYDENIIIEKTFPKGDYNVASIYSSSISGAFKENEQSFYLSGANEKYLIREEYACFGLAVMGNTRKPKEKLADFLELAVNNADGRIDLAVGFENKFYKDNVSYYSLLGDHMDVINRHDIDMIVDLEGTSRLKPIIYGDNAVFAENIKMKLDDNRKVDEELAINFRSNLSYHVPFDMTRLETEAINANLFNDTADLFRNILYKDMPIEDAVEEYIRWTELKYKWIDELDRLNAG